MNKRARGRLRPMFTIPAFYLSFIQEIPPEQRSKKQRKMLRTRRMR